MLVQLLRRLIACAAIGACASSGEGGTYLTSASVRRSVLEASLANKDNEYAKLRLAHYPTDWDLLPVENALEIPPAALAGDEAALTALGERAFFEYPLQRAPLLNKALESPAAYGFWTDAVRGVGGIVKTSTGPSYSCATCHARKTAEGIVPGLANDAIDIGALRADSGARNPENLLRWGPGQVDLTSLDGTEPVRIPDLRSIRFQTDLQATASVILNDVTSLAVRIETLIITSNDMHTRPPREIALGLARYLFSLGERLPMRAEYTDSEQRGKTVFGEHCAGCHAPPRFSGPAVSMATVGTDPRVGLSAQRGTGNYRVPSLRGVSTRGPLIHDGSAASLEMMFDPTRTQDGYVGRLGSPVRGHPFGLDLDVSARADLLAYLRTL